MQSSAAAPDATVTLRVVACNTDRAIARLAALDSVEHLPQEPLLVAEVDGQPRAALSLVDGTVVADPFHLTAGLVSMLKIRAEMSSRQANDAATRVRPRRVGRLRAA